MKKSKSEGRSAIATVCQMLAADLVSNNPQFIPANYTPTEALTAWRKHSPRYVRSKRALCKRIGRRFDEAEALRLRGVFDASANLLEKILSRPRVRTVVFSAPGQNDTTVWIVPEVWAAAKRHARSLGRPIEKYVETTLLEFMNKCAA